MKLKDLKVGTKLSLSFGIITFILLVIGVRSYQVITHLEENKKDLIHSTELADNIMESKFALRSDQLLIMEIIEAHDLISLEAYLEEHKSYKTDIKENLISGVSISTDNSWGAEFSADKRHAKTTLDNILSDYEQKFESELLNVYNTKLEMISSGIKSVFVVEKLVGQLELADEKADEVAASHIELLNQLEDEYEINVVDALVKESEILKIKATREISILIIISVLFAVIITIIITRGITIALKEGITFSNKLAEGDLTAIITSDRKDEIGVLSSSLTKMGTSLSEIVNNIRNGAENIMSASQQLNDTSQELSQGSSEQASSAEEISSSIEEMAANIEQNTSNATQTEQVSKEANAGIQEVAQRSQNAVQANKEIADKITIINDIAFQTNILALNAAVEAARAGEHGKGFAVVAAEVRKLAERSKTAAEEIVTLAQTSLELATGAGEVMMNTMPKIENTTQLVSEIAAASNEQNSGTVQISSAIQQLNAVTQQNAASSEEMATSSEELASQAEQLNEMISFFKTANDKNFKGNIRRNAGKPKHTISDKTVTKTNSKPVISLVENEVSDSEFENF